MDGFFQNKTGHFDHRTIIGQQYGSKIYNNKSTGYVYVLRPDPVLLTDSIAHKTQILYQADISIVISKLNIQPGSIVVESGTGSASLSSSIARVVQNSGHLFTFEFNEERAKNGQEVLNTQKLKNFDVIWRDVISFGFLPQEGEKYNLSKNKADAVFLDLPRPSEAICHAVEVLKKGGRLCCFSPCIESVQKNCEEMRKYQFVQIETIEILQRNFYKRENEVEDDNNANKSNNENDDEEDEQQHYNSKNQVLYTSGPSEIKGHTGYLTFAIYQ
ncbi:tRNA methyltransferase, putative [Ichthyophthirius multifiliis]|uniref:tRNA (adenine(58)-N(1))-methyltransferase n=1 Tax=Ichthyophthirius multifiliis TaxID=5932 RepID=G0QUC0_ICHMU|nr:tRNA methyltransferase, putative [Ichthyophthirius multifiliis]EGR31192.1 tRNA methyltransferase, putative [Ichthyophthirius multifiliis]|eukprot:XP_004034678.1 tRNA methyltransferase, putative [Ichthyophthirius multifiliis]